MQHFLGIPTSALTGREGESPFGREDCPVPSQIIVLLKWWRMHELLGTLTKSTRTSSQDGRQLRRCAAAQLRRACDDKHNIGVVLNPCKTFSIRATFADMDVCFTSGAAFRRKVSRKVQIHLDVCDSIHAWQLRLHSHNH